MRKIAILMLLLLGMAPLAHAQQGLSIGAMFQVDNDRIEVATGVSFTMAAYTHEPPVEGMDSSDLIGLFSSSVGQYPQMYRGLWLKVVVHPGGFKNLQGVDYDHSGHLARDAKGWEQLSAEDGGGYSMNWRADRIGALPLRFRIRHRDGRDRFTLLIFTATWTRGGNLPVALEVMIQRGPSDDPLAESNKLLAESKKLLAESKKLRAEEVNPSDDPLAESKKLLAESKKLRAEEALPYLRGFIPATARAEGQVTQQKVEVPVQTATQTLPKAEEPPKEKEKPIIPPAEKAPEPEVEYATPKLGAFQTTAHDHLNLLGDRLSDLERRILEDARKSIIKQSETLLLLSSNREQVVLVMSDDRPFTAEVVLNGKSSALKVRRVNNRYEAVTWGKIQSFIDKSVLLVITDDDGQTRTITFAKEANAK